MFYFAGEVLIVTKEVDTASKEVKQLFSEIRKKKKKTQRLIPLQLPYFLLGGYKTSRVNKCLWGKWIPKQNKQMKNKTKEEINTLEQFKLDWESFKEEEKIGEELAIQN